MRTKCRHRPFWSFVDLFFTLRFVYLWNPGFSVRSRQGITGTGPGPCGTFVVKTDYYSDVFQCTTGTPSVRSTTCPYLDCTEQEVGGLRKSLVWIKSSDLHLGRSPKTQLFRNIVLTGLTLKESFEKFVLFL